MHPRGLRRVERAAAWGLAALLSWCLVVLPAFAQEGGAEVTELQVDRTEEGVLLSSAVQFDLPPVIDEALAKGIPMYFVAEAALFRDRWYWYDKRIASASRHMRLSYQPLTRRWRLQVSPQSIGSSGLVLGQSFDTREEALAAIQRISRWRIAEPHAVEPGARYTLEFRFRLDISQLPRPFQIGAVGQNDWNIVASHSQRLQLEPPR